MKSEEGMKLRERMATMKKMAADAVKENGSSDIAFREFFRIWQFDEDHQLHPVPASDLPEVLLGPHNEQYKATIVLFEQLVKAKGILANTFEWLEPAAVKAIQDGSPRP
ncbi:hypothetical protein EJB05_52861, partial [Eragrostis curvula]